MTEYRYRTRAGEASQVLRAPNERRHTFTGSDLEFASLSFVPGVP